MRLRPLLAMMLVPAAALAAPKKQPAAKDAKGGPAAKNLGPCGAKVLPLVEGNSWTYSAVTAPNPVDDKYKRMVPPEPDTIVITVKSVDSKKGGDTTVTLEEKSTTTFGKDSKKPTKDERTLTTTIVCNATNKFEISPDSFWFAGEPGGYLGLKLDSVTRSKDTSLKLVKGGIGDAKWREDMVIKWQRVPTEGSGAKLGSGKLELEREFQPQQPELIVTKLGSYTSEKLGLTTTGRVTLDDVAPDTKPMELPAGWISTIWIASNVGVVQTLDSFAHMYQLTDATLK